MNLISFYSLIKIIKIYNPDEVDIIRKAYLYAEKKHEGQFRKSGEPYIYHPLRVACILAEMHADRDTICAALLHDVIEDTDATKEDITKEFNPSIANIVDGVTKLSINHFPSKKDQKLSNERKIITGIMHDPRILIVKLADRLDNMRTLNSLTDEQQQRITKETMRIYVRFAYYIGAYRIARELEDLSFKYIEPDIYIELSKELSEIKEEGIKYLQKMKRTIQADLYNSNIDNCINCRIKGVYSVYEKMLKNIKMRDIHDLLALKIIVQDLEANDSEMNCYRTLGIVHRNYHQVDFRFKDYISRPKTNMYRSLHTTVNGPNGRLVQTQIRTFEMDRINENGLTAYWDMNKGLAKDAMIEDLGTKFQFFKTLKTLDRNIRDNGIFIDVVNKELFSKNIYVFMPNGETIEIPEGFTVNDLIDRMRLRDGIGAIVNDEGVDLNHILHNKDSIKIIKSGNIIDPLGIVKRK